MIFYLTLILITALLQTTITGLNLTLLVVLAVSTIRRDTLPLILSFVGGLILGFLSGQNLGFYPLVFLVITQLVRLYRLLPISSNPIFLLPVVCGAVILDKIATSLVFQQTINWYDLPILVALFYLFYGIVAFIEDRFNNRPDLRLKIR